MNLPFQVREKTSILNHVYGSIQAFFQLECLRVQDKIEHSYEIRRNLFLKTIKNFMTSG